MKLAALFSDHAVLQQGISVPVWGWTRPKVRVRVTVGSAVGEHLSDSTGRFLVRLPPQAPGGPYTLVAETHDHAERVVLQNVCVGEVWVCSGQSNMQWTFNDGSTLEGPVDVPGVRMISLPRCAMPLGQDDVEAAWQVATPASVAAFSSVAFHLGRRLHQELGVPVGLINSSWGGTRIEAWTSRATLVRHPATAGEIHRYEGNTHRPAFWEACGEVDVLDKSQRPALAAGYPADPGNDAEQLGWAKPEFDDSTWDLMALPGAWQLRGYAGSGIFWFRRTIDIPSAWAGRDLELNIGAVDKHDITYFNGERVGATGTGFDRTVWTLNRCYRVPGRLVKAGPNLISVRVYSFINQGGMIGPEDVMVARPAEGPGSIPLAGSWRAKREHDLGLVILAEPLGPGHPNSPYILYDSLIRPLIPFGIRGVAWYQGESNEGNSRDYGRLLVSLIRDWRQAWGQGDFPFLTVQLANYRAAADFQPTSLWPYVREGQMKSLSEPGTGLAVAIDIGEARNIHPLNKAEVGSRLAQWALARVYAQPLVPSGPLYAGMTIEGDRIRLRFDHVGSGLVAKGGPLRTVMIAGESKVFMPAKAWIEGATVVVQCHWVQEPMAVRYAWADNPEGCNLYNAEGLPASPFRTDEW